MDDAVLVSPHYHYDPKGRPLPPPDAVDYQNLSMIIPLGLLHVAQHLHDRGYRVRVVHLPHAFYALQRLGLAVNQLADPLEAVLSQYPARICGIQAHFYLYCGGAVRVAEVYKKIFPDSTVLVGGYMATACWQDFLAMPGIDGVVLGEGEKTFERVIANAAERGAGFLNAIDGVAARNGRGRGAARPARPTNLLPLEAMAPIAPKARPFADLLWPRRSFINISRGLCPEACTYCVANNRTINPRRFQFMQIDRILEQLRLYQDHGIQSVFLGENHFLDTAFMKALIAAIIAEKLNLTFELETHPALFEDKDLLPKMVAAGFHRYTMGGESGSDALLKRMGRRSSSRQIMAGVRRIADAGGLAVTSWICNLPGESASGVRATTALLERVVAAGGFIYWIENLHVLPGSALHAHPEKWGIDILLERLSDWIRWAQVSKSFVTPEDAARDPLRYLTHRNHGTAPQEMMRRFFAQRRRARDLVPEMKANLSKRAAHLPPELARSEMQKLDWYAAKGWQLLLF
jgi:anaerobic magnesium-protoporphyrin IX monomethyl ester cyclase